MSRRHASASSFGKGPGGGVFTCGCCGRRTRATGRRDNENNGTCAECFGLAGEENHMSDHGGELYSVETARAAMHSLTAKGIDAIKLFPEIAKKLGMLASEPATPGPVVIKRPAISGAVLNAAPLEFVPAPPPIAKASRALAYKPGCGHAVGFACACAIVAAIKGTPPCAGLTCQGCEDPYCVWYARLRAVVPLGESPEALAMAKSATPARMAFEVLIRAALDMLDVEQTDEQRAIADEVYQLCNRLEYTFDTEVPR
jgi:hypothetical protein